MQRALFIVAIALAVLVDGFFAIVNFFPTAPQRDRGPRRYVLMQLDDDQIAWFQRNMLDEYNDEHGTNLVVRDVETAKIADEMNAADAVLSVLPATIANRAADAQQTRSFDSVVPRAQIAKDFDQLLPEVVSRAQFGERQHFLPRAVALSVIVYRISRVQDAMLHWHLLRDDINAALRTANGRGLPAGYELEHNPAGWDSYDQFVLAYYWSHRVYHGRRSRGRMAHRTGPSVDAQVDLSAGVFRAGATTETFATRDSDAAVDWMQWETLYRAQDLYADAMFIPGGMDDEDTLEALSRGRIYWASIDEVEAFSLHGGGHRDAAPRVRDQDDLGFVARPRFASLELDSHGAPVRKVDSFSFREEDVWVLPKNSADAELAYDLVKWVMERENHTRECEALGTLPIRRDVISQRATLFRQPWMQEVFEAGLAQWPHTRSIPADASGTTGLDYAILWDRIVKQRAVMDFSRTRIAELLRAPVDRVAGAHAISIHAAPAEVASPTRETNDAGSASLEYRIPPLREPVTIDRHRTFGTDAGTIADESTEGGRP